MNQFIKLWKPSWLPNLAIAAIAFGYMLLFLYLSGDGLDHLYGRSPYHRLQAQALLQGKFSLADSIYQMAHDLAWYKGKIQHVWGLGVGLWLMPFEAIWNWIGKENFPDRLALGFVVLFYAVYAVSTAVRIGRTVKSRWLGLLLGIVLLFYPPFWLIALAPQLVYEETVFYACLVSQIIFVALLRIVFYGEVKDYLLCCCLGAWVPYLRATHVIYGFTAVVLATICLCYPKLEAKPRSNKRKMLKIPHLGFAGLGLACYLGGIGFLLWSNAVRFGSPLEFGHGLTVTPEMNLFFSRFSPANEWGKAWPLAKELVGWIFLPPRNLGGPWSTDNLVYFQAAVPRWRDVYLPTFNLGYLATMLIGIGWGIRLLYGRLRKLNPIQWGLHPISRGLTVLLVWTVVCHVFLYLFYIRLTSMSSRYIMDFGPAILTGVLLAIIWAYRHWPKVTLVIVLAAIALDLGRIRENPIVNLPTKTPLIKGLAASLGNTIDEYHGSYSLEAHPSETDMMWNGMGWQQSGMAGPLVIVAVDNPRYVEVTVGPRLEKNAGTDCYRARMAEFELPLISNKTVDNNQVLRFEVPETLRRRGGDEFLFLCFVKTFEVKDRESHRKLLSIRWQ